MADPQTLQSAMDMRLAFEIAIAVACGSMGWFLRLVFDRIKGIEESMRKESDAIQDLRVYLPTNYATKQDMKDTLDPIHQALRRIEEKLDQKVDKE